MVERVRARAEEGGMPVSLVGWSLGGTIAREVARDAPDAIVGYAAAFDRYSENVEHV